MKFTLSLLVSGYDDPISTFCTDDSELDPFIYELSKQYINCMQDGFYLSNQKEIIELMEAINPKQKVTTDNFLDEKATDNDVYLDVRRSFYNDFKYNDVWALTLELPESYVKILEQQELELQKAELEFEKEIDLLEQENNALLSDKREVKK